ncbi:MAG: endonuclease/exonuclease/phosphatase family protein [Gaiellaceae bacterium]
MVIETWNIFHGNAIRPLRRSFLREAVQLATGGEPDILCLQELPAWALHRLREWTPYAALTAVAARPALGPLPSTAEIGRVLTSIHAGLLRSAFSGQGNAILLAPPFRALEHHVVELNPRRFRRAQGRWLGLGLSARLVWGNERRVCQVARIADAARTLVVANMHATSYSADRRLADAELLRAFTFVDGLAQTGEPIVVAGDFNITAEESRTLREVVDWGFSKPGPGIDHVLVRGLEIVGGPWRTQHRVDGIEISDHRGVKVDVA